MVHGLVSGHLRGVRTPCRPRPSCAVTSMRGPLRSVRAKVVVLGRDDAGRPEWNSRMLDFALRVGFEMRLCRLRAQTTEPFAATCGPLSFSDDAEMNRQGMEWCETVAVTLEAAEGAACDGRTCGSAWGPVWRRISGTCIGTARGTASVVVGRQDCAGGASGTVEIWLGSDRLAVHPRHTGEGSGRCRASGPGWSTGMRVPGGRP